MFPLSEYNSLGIVYFVYCILSCYSPTYQRKRAQGDLPHDPKQLVIIVFKKGLKDRP